MIEEIRDQYKAQFKGEPTLIKAPGRINLIGEHTDYNNGFVMPASVDKAMYFAIGINEEQEDIQIQALNYGTMITLNGEGDLPSWAKYFKAIVELLKERGVEVKGVNCVFGGDIPIGAGLSSSAALCCGFIYGVSNLMDLNIPRTEIALIAQAAEHKIGVNCGLMDPYAVLFGKKNQVFRLDCQDLSVEYFPLVLEDHSLVLINSKIEHELEGTPYNDRRNSCESVVKIIASKYPDVKSLRDVNMKMLLEFENEIDALDIRRVKYILEENDRVLQMMEVLKAGKLEEAGQILLRGHEGMSKEYDISLPEIDLLVELAKKEESVLGGRMMGGGFGGCTINLIENKNKAETLKNIKSQYQKSTGILPEVYDVKPGEGLQIISL